MDRLEIERTLNEDRAWLLNTYSQLDGSDLTRPVTQSEHDETQMWSAKDHLVHLLRVERRWNTMIRKHIAGETNTVGLDRDAAGKTRSREEAIASVHQSNETWTDRHRDASLDEIVAFGQATRGETLQLLSELTQQQLDDAIPGAPWAEGKVGGILAANAGHGRMHWKWVKEARDA